MYFLGVLLMRNGNNMRKRPKSGHDRILGRAVGLAREADTPYICPLNP
jgi:hypothetical protein